MEKYNAVIAGNKGDLSELKNGSLEELHKFLQRHEESSRFDMLMKSLLKSDFRPVALEGNQLILARRVF